MDPKVRGPRADSSYGGLFANPPSANTGRKRARLEVGDAQIESDKDRIARAISEARDRGLTRKEISAATGIIKDTVNRRLGHDLLPTGDYYQPWLRDNERVVVHKDFYRPAGEGEPRLQRPARDGL